MGTVEIVRTGATSFAAWVDGASVYEAAYHTGLGQWEVIDPSTGDCVEWADTRGEALGLLAELSFRLRADQPGEVA